MNYKKINIYVTEFPPQPGGIGNHAYNLALQLVTKGYNVQVFCDYRSSDNQEEKVFDALQPFKTHRFKRRKILAFTYLNRILSLYKYSDSKTVVLASGKFYLWAIGLFPFIKRKKILSVVHGSEVNFKGWRRKLTNIALQKYDELIAVSNYTKNLMDTTKFKNITVIPNGFHLNQTFSNFQEGISKKNSLNLITVGNVSYRKGQHNVIRALPLIKQFYSDVKYYIVGIPSEKDYLMVLIKELELEEDIIFYGRLEEEEKIKLVAQSDIFMMLSDQTPSGDVEGFGIAIIEANALAVPAIGSKDCGIEDAISPYFSGILVSPKDAQGIAEAVKNVMQNKEEFAENAKIWANRFTWEEIINRYINVIEG